MARYIARVELKGNPSRETYDKLHTLMRDLGFRQTIEGTHDDIRVPVVADLPHATYAGLSDLSTAEVSIFLAEHIKKAIQPDIALLVARPARGQECGAQSSGDCEPPLTIGASRTATVKGEPCGLAIDSKISHNSVSELKPITRP